MQLGRHCGRVGIATDLGEKLGECSLVIAAGKMKSLESGVKRDSMTLQDSRCNVKKQIRTVQDREIKFNDNAFPNLCHV